MDASSLKRRAVGTGVGRFLVRARRRWELVRKACFTPEQGGTASQDAITQILLPRLCRPSAAFVDVGAHIGSVIAEVRACNPRVRIVAIEALPEKAAHLARRFPDVEVHGVALGDRQAEVSFFVDRKHSGYSSLAPDRRDAADTVRVTVPMRRMDDVVPRTLPVDVVKIDVEGAELGVLRGATGLVARCRPVVVFESGPDDCAALGFSIEALYDWFAERAYEVLVPDRVAHDGPSLGRDGFVEAHYYPHRSLDYFAVPAERRTEIRDVARRILGVR